MARRYPPEFRRKVLDRVKSGRTLTEADIKGVELVSDDEYDTADSNAERVPMR